MKKVNSVRAFVALVLPVAMLFGVTTIASATSTSLGLFSLLNEGAAQGNSMVVGYGASSEGGQLVTYWDTGSNIMDVVSLGNGQYEIVETLGNRCMTVNAIGGAATITTCTGNSNQLFALKLQGDGSYVIQSTAGSCIAAPNGFAAVVAQACNSSLDQNWNFKGAIALNLGTTPTAPTTPTTPTTPTSLGLFSILNEGAAQGNSMTVAYGRSSEGGQLLTFWQTGSNIMNVLSLGNSQYEIVETFGNRCMTAVGAQVSITACTGAANQLFALNLQAGGSYVIQSTAGSCIAAPGSFSTVVAQACNSSLDQDWNFTGATALNLGSGTPTSPTNPITNSPTVPAGYHLTFDDEFQSLSISDTNGAGTNWYTHTVQCCLYDTSNPSTPTYMAGVSDGAGKNSFSLIPGQGLDIRLQKTNGAWYSGVLATVDGTGSGFSQRYGYFEMKANFPAGLGTWPAFWFLNSAHLSQGVPAGEIDLVESYMQFPTIVNTTLHDWGNSTTVGFNQAAVPNLSNGFHTYGMLWTASIMTFYFDGAAIWQTPTPAIMNQPYYPIIDLGLGGGWPTNQTPQQSDMIVQYVRAYSN